MKEDIETLRCVISDLAQQIYERKTRVSELEAALFKIDNLPHSSGLRVAKEIACDALGGEG